MLKIPAAVAALVVVAGGLSMLADPASAPEQGERRGDDGATADVAEDPGRKRVEKTPIDPAPEDDVQPAGALPAPVDLDACDRDRDVHGRVVSADGEPLPGATIATVRYPWRRTGFLNMEGYETGEPVDERLSAEDGTFAVRLRRGELVHLEVSADGYAPTKISQVQAGERLRVELSRPGTGAVGLTVRVLDEDGNLVPEANVHVFSLSGVTPVVNRKAVTDADGSAGFEGMPANSAVVIDVSAPDYGSPGWTQRRIASEPEQREEVTLPRGRTLRGRVTDTATGAPIAGAKVGMNWVQRHPVTSDEDGNFALPGWTGRGATEIVATAAGYGRQKHVVGEREVVDFALRAGDTVTGRLVTPAGKPVGGALVAAVGSQHDGTVQTSSFGHTISEPSGRFSVADLRRDLPHTLIVAAEGHGRTLYDFDPHAGAAGTIDLGDVIVHDGHSIEGVVVDADGEPMPRLMVIVQGANSDRGKLRSRAPTVDHFYGNSEDRYTDDQGRFRFPDLAPGTYLVKVRPHGAPEQQRSVTLHGEDVADLEIALNSGHRVKIMVLGPDGEPIAGAYVAPITGGGNTQTDGSGVGYLTLPRGANVQLSVFTMGSTNPEWVVPSAQMVSSSASEVTFQYKRAKLVRVRLLDPSGDPIEGAQVEARRGAELVRSGTTEADGRVTIKVSDEGPVDLTISPNKIIKEGRRMRWELLPFTGSAEGVRPGAEQETVIRCTALTFDAELTVRVVGPDDDAVSGAMIYIARPAMPGRQGLVTGADGRVHITELPSTEITVMAMLNADKLPEGWMPPKAGTATADGGELVLKFRRAMFVTGAVTLPDGKPAAKCVVDARRGEQAITAGQTDADGRFRLIVASDEEPFSVGATAIGEGAKMLRDAATGVRPGDDLRLSLKKE
jgi:protocatechuate 3,4-dioxygenase beta subunit